MIVNILIGNALIGTLFVGLFTLRHLVKLRRELAEHHNSAAAPPTEEHADYRCAVPQKGVVHTISIDGTAQFKELLDEGLIKPQNIHYNVHSGQFETRSYTAGGGGGAGGSGYVKLYREDY